MCKRLRDEFVYSNKVFLWPDAPGIEIVLQKILAAVKVDLRVFYTSNLGWIVSRLQKRFDHGPKLLVSDVPFFEFQRHVISSTWADAMNCGNPQNVLFLTIHFISSHG